MKKIPGLLLLLLVVFLNPGCKKSSPDATVPEVNAHVIDGGDPIVDGMGLYIHIDSTNENIIPTNLPADFQQRNINSPVSLKFIDTGKRHIAGFGTAANGGLRLVYIVSIRKL
jgi:hypothetical protein